LLGHEGGPAWRSRPVEPLGALGNAVPALRCCEPRLAYFAIPRYIEFLAALPLTENGKVRKFVLCERGVTETAWDREAAGYVLRR
jgi:carnitine-CoA ligase